MLFRGAGPSASTGEVADRLTRLKSELSHLDSVERTIDLQKKHVQQSIVNISEDPTNHQYPFCL